MQLIAGQKKKLSELAPHAQAPHAQIQVGVTFDLPDTDISVFGLDDERQLRDDRYMVFFNQPRSPEGEVQASFAPGQATFSLNLAALPPSVTRLMFTATHDQRPLRDARQLTLSLGPATFDALTTLKEEKAVMLAELYRYGDEWRVNMVGQGFNGGLAALVEYFGGEVEGEAEGPASEPASQGPTSPAAAPVTPPAMPPASPAPGVSQGPVTQRPVNLQKNQSVNLSKATDAPLARISFGLGWEPAVAGGPVDLDAGCLVFDENRRNVDKVWFMHLSGQRGAVRHSGDNLTGHGSGDDERVSVDLTRLDPGVRWLVLTVNSFSGQRFSTLKKAYCRVLDDATGRELARYELLDAGNVTGAMLAKLERRPDGWHFTALGVPGGGMTLRALVKPAQHVL